MDLGHAFWSLAEEFRAAVLDCWETRFRKVNNDALSGQCTQDKRSTPSEWSQVSCCVVNFFFDYRADDGVANTEVGLLKTILDQLCEALPAIEDDLADRYIPELEQPVSQTRLFEILCKAVERCEDPLFAFIDGLDE